MTTKAELVAQIKAENPTMTATVNDESIQLNKAEYEKACSDWADMKLAQIKHETELLQQETTKAALLERIGMSADEAQLLLG